MISFFLWYLVITIIGLLSFPISYRLLPSLPDRGYSLSRILGLIFWGYVFWMLASLGIIRNTSGGLLLALGVVLAVSIWTARGITKADFTQWLRKNRITIICVEGLFLIAFSLWSVVRAANPEIVGTEKPMELAFINAILNSPEFPPHDPWLSGYAISYYYFGYILIAMLAKITSISGGIAFNLGVALIFALSAVAAFGVTYDLLAVRVKSDWKDTATESLNDQSQSKRRHWLYAFLGPLFILIVSNFEGILHVLHTRGLFWRQDKSGQLISSFWTWLDIKDLNQPPISPLTWVPEKHWWWWRASRVLQDYDMSGNWKEIINEFPLFSFLLGDLHPHVLAIPFALLLIGFILNLFLGGGQGVVKFWKFKVHINIQTYFVGALLLGGMMFLNTWDFPFYVALFCGAYIFMRSREEGWYWGLVWEFIGLGIVLGISGIVLYLPFYLGFSSQAGGILPNLIYPTRGAHLWVMFGPLLLPLIAYLIYLWRRGGDRRFLLKALIVTLLSMLLLMVLAVILGFGIVNLPIIGGIYLDSLGGAGQSDELIPQIFLRRVSSPGGWLTLALLMSVVLGFLWPKPTNNTERVEENRMTHSHSFPQPYPLHPVHVYALLLVALGLLAVIGVEFFYLRDQFGWRINTIFKFYYQAWLLWGIAVAFGSAVLLQDLHGKWGMIYRLGLIFILFAALVYPVLSIWSKTNSFQPAEGLTLDGTAYFENQNPDEMAAIQWLQTAPPGVVLEAVGGSYSNFGRISTMSGKPTMLGWPGHESQWRGGGTEMGSRLSDIEQIYRSASWNEVEELIRQYDIKYIYIGSLERSSYGVNENKFKIYLTPVFEQGQVTIYEIPRFE
jgi:YYY domain-containing protein